MPGSRESFLGGASPQQLPPCAGLAHPVTGCVQNMRHKSGDAQTMGKGVRARQRVTEMML